VKKLVLLTTVICFLTVVFSIAQEAEFQTNTVYFEKVTVKPGEHFTVKVYMFNTDTLAGMQVPTFYRSEKIDLYCDSVSFAGSRCEYMMFSDTKIPEDDKVVYFSFINTIDPKNLIDPLPPGDGLIATIYFTAPDNGDEGAVKLTRGMIPHPHISFIFAVWDRMGDELSADFKDSEIIIKSDKSSLKRLFDIF